MTEIVEHQADVRYCACGCGERLRTRWTLTWFRPGHHSRVKVPKSYRLRGGEGIREHRTRAEEVLGHPLPRGAQIHHVEAIHDNNRLVICESDAYHKLLHARTRIVRAGGNPNTEKICGHCRVLKARRDFPPAAGRYDDLYGWCRACSRADRVDRRLQGRP